MTKRLNAPELIDLGPAHYTEEEYEECLYQLGRIGKYLGGDRATLWAFKQLKEAPQSILDVGCGGGQLAILLGKRYREATIKGIDLSYQAIAFARKQLQKTSLENVHFIPVNEANLNEPHKSYDVVTCTLVCHHLTDEEIIHFIEKSSAIAKQAVIINDLHRHWLASMAFMAISPLFFPNRLIFHDGLLSIKRSFKRNDWANLLQKANIPASQWSLTWHPFFRWILIIYPENQND